MAECGDPDCVYTLIEAGYPITQEMMDGAAFGGQFYPTRASYWAAVNQEYGRERKE